MKTTRYFTLVLALAALAATAAVATAADTPAEQDEAQLIAVLQGDSPKADKAITCKRLAVFGSKKAVPALAALLPDKELTSWARIALEVIPGPEADAALRDAMKKTEGRTLVGVINSIAVRRDAKAVPALVERVGDADVTVATAAAAALGHVGGPEAVKALEKAMADGPDKVRSAAAEGCILCAEQALADGNAAEAVRLYDEVRSANVPKPRVIEATRGAILARGADGVPLLVEQLGADDWGFLGIGLMTARELPGKDVTKALVAELDKLPADRQALLIVALADRNDPAALPAMLQAAKSGAKNVRLSALQMLQNVGDASCVPALLDIALENDEELAQAAKAAFEGLPGEGVDADLAARLARATGPMRALLIQLAGQRRIAAAVPSLLTAADDSDASVRAAALAALGETIGPDDLAVLISRVTSPAHAEDREAAEQALRTAAIRMPDGEACAAKLVDAMAKAPLGAKVTILEILGSMGGQKALAALGSAAKDASPELQDTATRLLGEWMDVDAAPVLLDLAKTAPDDKYKIRAMRGYIRLVRQFTIPDAERVEMCRKALATADRDAEKRLVLEVMERYPSVDMLRLAVETAENPALKENASATAMSIAQQVARSADVRELLAQIGQKPVKVEIIKAEYGAGATQKDVTDVLRRRVRGFPLIILPKDGYNASFGGDPAPGVVKQLKVQYRINGKEGEATFKENATILLPTPK